MRFTFGCLNEKGKKQIVEAVSAFIIRLVSPVSLSVGFNGTEGQVVLNGTTKNVKVEENWTAERCIQKMLWEVMTLIGGKRDGFTWSDLSMKGQVKFVADILEAFNQFDLGLHIDMHGNVLDVKLNNLGAACDPVDLSADPDRDVSIPDLKMAVIELIVRAWGEYMPR